ncbi:TonB-dependent siderophore receptor [Pseudomonas syringae]|nr:TonB-dependent siderophore receptor [Pseudomonas syringae]
MGTNTSSPRTSQHLSLLAAALLMAGTAMAQQITYPLDIAPQALDQALNALAGQTGSRILFATDVAEGRQVPGLRGSLTLEQALERLVGGTGLRVEKTEDGSYLVAKPRENGPVELSPTPISSNALGTITEASKSYTPGTLATATRLVLTPRETPQSISVVTRQKMDDFALNSIDDVMRQVPGITVTQYDVDRSQYYARGFAIQNYQYDGIPMLRDSAYSAGHNLSDTAIYDRIEVLKGATGLLTGTGDPGATINLIRKKPTHEFQGHVQAGAGSWDNYRTELDISGSLTESGNVRGRAVAAYQDKHSYLDRYQRKTQVYYGIFEIDLGPDTLLTMGADYQDNEPKGSSWGGSPIFDSNGNFNETSRSFNNGAQWSSWEQYTRTVFSTVEHNFDNGWVGKVQLNHQINGYDVPVASIQFGNPNPLTGTGTRLGGPTKYVGETRSNAADMYLSGPFQLFGREHELVVGASITRRHWTNDLYTRPVSYNRAIDNYYAWNGDVPEPEWIPFLNNDEITRERGGYLVSRFNITDDLKLTTGARVINYKSPTLTETGVLVPYGGVVYDLNSNFSVYASYTSIFKPQSFRDGDGKTLDPIEGNNYEAGIKGSFFDGNLNTSLAYFELEQDNYAEVSGGFAPDGSTAYKGTKGVKTKGYELEVSGELARGWQVQAGFTHAVSRRDNVRVSTIEPEDQASFYTSYNLPSLFQPVTLGGGARWRSKSYESTTNPVRGTEDFIQGSYWLVDLMARYQISENLSATLNANNLLDKKYYTIWGFNGTYNWGDPRNVSANIRWDF